MLVNSTLILRKYLNSITEEEKRRMPKYIDIKKIKNYEYLGWFFSIIIFFIISLGLSGDVRKLFKFLTMRK